MLGKFGMHLPWIGLGPYYYRKQVRLLNTNQVPQKVDLLMQRDDLLHALSVARTPMLDPTLPPADYEFVSGSYGILYQSLVIVEGELVSICSEDELHALIFG